MQGLFQGPCDAPSPVSAKPHCHRRWTLGGFTGPGRTEKIRKGTRHRCSGIEKTAGISPGIQTAAAHILNPGACGEYREKGAACQRDAAGRLC